MFVIVYDPYAGPAPDYYGAALATFASHGVEDAEMLAAVQAQMAETIERLMKGAEGACDTVGDIRRALGIIDG